MEVKSLGRQWAVEYYDCAPELLNDVAFIRKAMVKAAEAMGATIVEQVFHHFSPHGVSGVVVIAESHLAIHTWPEYNYAAVDLFTCGSEVDPEVGFHALKESLGSLRFDTERFLRGRRKPIGCDVLHKPLVEA